MKRAADLDSLVLLPQGVYAKLRAFERLDLKYKFVEMKDHIESDEDVASWWVYHVYNTPFVWRFLYSPEDRPGKAWLYDRFAETVGPQRLQQTKQTLLQHLASCGETLEQNL